MSFDQAQNTNLRTNSRRTCTLFAVTVKYTIKSKAHVYDVLERICTRLLVSEETHFNHESHHHVYMRAIDRLTSFQIFNIINRIYGKPILIYSADLDLAEEINGVLVQSVRNETSYLKYITKSDCDPLFKGISESQLSFYYNAIKWAKNTIEFDFCDPFVLNHPQYYKLLESVLANVHSKKQSDQLQALKPFFGPIFCNQARTWQEEVIKWWNDWIVNGYKHKKKQLFLWGGSNTGKTTFITSLIKNSVRSSETLRLAEDNLNESDADDNDSFELQIFSPSANEKRFAWQDFDPKRFNIVLIDEFDISEYNVTELKKVLAGESLIANRKGQSAKKMKLKMPMIIISNLAPPRGDETSQCQGFIERLHVVKADRLILI